MRLRQRTILITGGTSGTGFELAKQLLERGNTVLVTGRDQEKIELAKRALPGVHTFESDVRDPAAIAALHRLVLDRFPALDVLINNAGVMRNLDIYRNRNLGNELLDITREIEINLSGPVRMVQQFLPQLKAQKEALIVTVSSALAFVPYPASPVYSASKAALHSFTQSLRAQMRGSRVSVVELVPPAVETALFRTEFGEEMKKEKGMDVAKLAIKAIAGIEGGRLEIRPGLATVLLVASRVAPKLMFEQMVKLSVPREVVVGGE